MLKSGNVEEIQLTFKTLQHEINNIVDAVIELTYYMRGSVGYEEMMRRTYGERQHISSFIERHLERESKHMNPNY